MIQREDMVVTVTHGGYIKRVPLSTYRAQRRGGKGRSGMATRDEDFVSQVFVLNTHTPVLFFSSKGMVYKMKVYKLPLGSPTGRGKALVNLLPLAEGETITTLMPLPEDEASWEDLFVVFATASGNVRRNRLSDFVQVKANGKIAMKLDPDDRLIGVATCDEADDVLLATTGAKCIRFRLTDVRVFQGRNSTGVRGIKLAKGVEVISMSVLHHAEYTTAERNAYLKRSRAERADGDGGENGHEVEETEEDAEEGEVHLSEERYREMAEQEQFVLTVTAKGFGKRSSAYEYRVAGRGGQGIANIDLAKVPGNSVISSFPVEANTELVMMTDGGQLIRTGVSDVRIAGRSTRGVTLFRVAEDENVVTVTALQDDANGDDAEGDDGAEDDGTDVIADVPDTGAAGSEAGETGTEDDPSVEASDEQ
jgi:DNA gyrase subunit A